MGFFSLGGLLDGIPEGLQMLVVGLIVSGSDVRGRQSASGSSSTSDGCERAVCSRRAFSTGKAEGRGGVLQM